MTRALVLIAFLALTAQVDAQRLASEEDRHEALERYRSGQAYMTAERYELAAEEFTKAVHKDPLFSLAHYQLGQADMVLQRYASAIKAYQDCIAAGETLFALSQENHFAVERARDDEIREMRAAVQQLTQAGQQLRASHAEQRLRELEQERSSLGGSFHPSAEVLLALGSARYKSGDRAGAVAEWQAAVEANPKLGEAHNNLAVAYMMNGDRATAEQEVKAAERAGFRVNPDLKSDIRKMPKP